MGLAFRKAASFVQRGKHKGWNENNIETLVVGTI
jgi:hypothetical protein